MSRSYLIVGATAGERKIFVLKELAKYSSQFDQAILDTREKVGIAEIRELQRRVSRLPLNSKFNTAGVLEAQNLSIEAQNALLKTLEEPGEFTKIFLTSQSFDSILPTIASRCTLVTLPSKLEGDEGKLEKTKTLFRKILTSSLSERFSLRDELELGYLEILLYRGLHENDHFLKLSKNQIVQILKNLKETQRFLEGNVNKKLAYDVFLVSLPRNSSS